MKTLITILFILLSFEAYGNETVGKVMTPDIEIVNVLKVNSGDQVFAGMWGKGVYLSNDIGDSWEPRNNQLGNLYVNDIAFDSNDEIYAGTHGGGLYYSSNSGNQWTQLSLDTNLYITSVYVHPYDDDVIYAGTYGSGLFISTDKGSSWEPRNTSVINDGVHESIKSLHITAITISQDTTLIVGTYGEGLFRSTDNGQNWRGANSGTNGARFINELLIVDDDILAATNDGGLVESANDGLQWGKYDPEADSLLDEAITSVVYTDDAKIGTREAGIWYYNDQPYEDWLPSNIVTHYGVVDLVAFSDGTLLSYTINDGIMRCNDGGRTWNRNISLDNNSNNRNKIAANGNNYILNTLSGNLYISSDLGNTWDELSDYPGGVVSVMKYIYDKIVIISDNTAHISTDNGQTWTSSTTADNDDTLLDIAESPNGDIYMTMLFFIDAMPPGTPTLRLELYKTTDNGDNWSKIQEYPDYMSTSLLEVTPSEDIYFYQIDDNNDNVILKSTDGGDSFIQTGYSENLSINEMVFKNNNLYLATSDGLYISEDGGDSFNKINIPIIQRPQGYFSASETINTLAVHDQNNIYVGFERNWGVYKTTNGGTEWDSLMSGYSTFDVSSMTVNDDGDLMFTSGLVHKYLNGKNMGVPQLQKPTNGSYNISLQPNLEWDEAEKAELYQVELSTNDKFPFAQERVILEENQREVFYNLDYNTEYYWRVRGKADGVYSKWSAVSRFSTLLAPPELISPEDSSESISLAPEFEWEEVEDGSYYEIQVSSTAEFDDIVIHQDSVSETEYLTLVDERLEPLSWYYWRVRAKNENNTGEWSVVWIFRTGIGSPTLRFPENNSVNHPNNIEFVWYRSDETTNYRIQVSRMEDMSLIILDTETQNDTLQAFTDLNYNVDYYWRVAGIDSNGVQGPWSEIWKFSTGLEPPAHISPENNSGNMPSDVTLEWEETEGYTYSLQVAYNTNFATPVYNETNLSENTFELTDLQSNRTFYWRVRSFNDEGNESAWSNPWSFSTGLARVELLEPANGSTDREYKSQIFKWQGVNGAETYSLQISENATFTNIFYDEEDISLTSKDVYDFKAEQTYHWRVKASNESGSSDWSEVWSFTTKKVTMVTMDGEETGIRVYPNPAEDEVSIEMPQELAGSYNIELINSTGRTVMTDNLNGRYKNLKLAELNNSNYYIVISSDEKRFVIKISKVK